MEAQLDDLKREKDRMDEDIRRKDASQNQLMQTVKKLKTYISSEEEEKDQLSEKKSYD